jgi:hypothetical protein
MNSVCILQEKLIRGTEDMGTDSTPVDGVKGRSLTHKLIATDPRAALALARKIRHPWYRCQSLAIVAESESYAKKRDDLLEESLAAAYEQSEPNRIVSVAAWPLAHLVRADPEKADGVVRRLLATIALEPHGLRKLDGLTRIFFAVSGAPELREHVLPPLLSAAAASVGWRTERLIAHVAEILAESDPGAASALLASRTPNRFVRKAQAKLQSKECGA